MNLIITFIINDYTFLLSCWVAHLKQIFCSGLSPKDVLEFKGQCPGDIFHVLFSVNYFLFLAICHSGTSLSKHLHSCVGAYLHEASGSSPDVGVTLPVVVLSVAVFVGP